MSCGAGEFVYCSRFFLIGAVSAGVVYYIDYILDSFGGATSCC